MAFLATLTTLPTCFHTQKQQTYKLLQNTQGQRCSIAPYSRQILHLISRPASWEILLFFTRTMYNQEPQLASLQL